MSISKLLHWYVNWTDVYVKAVVNQGFGNTKMFHTLFCKISKEIPVFILTKNACFYKILQTSPTVTCNWKDGIHFLLVSLKLFQGYRGSLWKWISSFGKPTKLCNIMPTRKTMFDIRRRRRRETKWKGSLNLRKLKHDKDFNLHAQLHYLRKTDFPNPGKLPFHKLETTFMQLVFARILFGTNE